jgi:23S rRNA pseudouridine1911/1915/1917 synthase
MVVIKDSSDLKKAKWTPHHLTTEIVEYSFLPATRTSVLLLRIQKGFRHQIRAHLASIGFPICGDQLYSKSAHTHYPILQLFSIGLEGKR